MVVAAALTLMLTLLHAADDFARGEVTRPRTFALLVVAASVLYLLGIAYSWLDRRIGYLLVLGLSALFFYSTFLSHALGLARAHSILAIARGGGPFFAFVSLAGGVSSLAAMVLAGFALISPRPE